MLKLNGNINSFPASVDYKSCLNFFFITFTQLSRPPEYFVVRINVQNIERKNRASAFRLTKIYPHLNVDKKQKAENFVFVKDFVGIDNQNTDAVDRVHQHPQSFSRFLFMGSFHSVTIFSFVLYLLLSACSGLHDHILRLFLDLEMLCCFRSCATAPPTKPRIPGKTCQWRGKSSN